MTSSRAIRDRGRAGGAGGGPAGRRSGTPSSRPQLEELRIGRTGDGAVQLGRPLRQAPPASSVRSFMNGPSHRRMRYRLMLSSPGAPASVRRGEQVAIMMQSVTTYG